MTRDIAFIFLAVQLVGRLYPTLSYFDVFFLFFLVSEVLLSSIYINLLQVIASLAYLVYLIDTHQKSWLHLAWGFDSELSFYYICGNLKNLK